MYLWESQNKEVGSCLAVQPSTLFRMLKEELFDFLERDNIGSVIQIGMNGIGDNEQFLVIAL